MNDYIRKSLCKLLVEKVQGKKIIGQNFNFSPDISDWKNKDCSILADSYIGIDDKIIKRIFSLQGYQDSINILTRTNERTKVAHFLGFNTWEELEKKLILMAGFEIQVENFEVIYPKK